ncbi:E3 ubiquitin-protein ligase rnf146 isoform X1 [Leptinotarsa decemlineata]|uniref:E3 ubiquitin-protein ligase rnf146 isoform X1 n=1 Tax=Leptinotarsa decemlineata TaxID=7539 RepID=UPI000C254F71|nr:E3 ubiquitin-protein ligase rnf146-like [Leptinotarsa decemlineata]
MAESLQQQLVDSTCKENDENMECAVCLQRCIHPAQLPCGHIFCFLCVKGFANQNKKCAMCRQEIPKDFIDQPNLLEFSIPLENSEGVENDFQWFYEGRNGWWQYDERTSKDLEESYKKNESTCELLIAGFLYIVDLENMLQIRRNDPSRRRRIKRDHGSIPKKGIAGLPTNKSAHQQISHQEFSISQSTSSVENLDPIDLAESSDDQLSESSDEDEQDLDETLQRFENLNLEEGQ